MNYPESKLILEKIKKAKKILLNCHKGPDPDSIGSALAMSYLLKKWNKEVDIFCSSQIETPADFLEGFKEIKMADFAGILKNYDLFISPDTASWDFATGMETKPKSAPFTIVIDHHKSSTRYGEINLISSKQPATAEILFGVFEDWGVKIDKKTANALLTGIVADTGGFIFPGTSSKTLKVAGKLIELGADLDEVIFNLFFCTDLTVMKFWGKALTEINYDPKYKFVWVAIPEEEYKKYGGGSLLRSSFATAFLQRFAGTNFGVIMTEENELLAIGLRSRSGIDVSKLAQELGGGGHRYSAGGGIRGLPFDQAVKKALKVIRKFAKENK